MRKHDFYYNSQGKTCTKYVTLVALATFCLAVTTFALLEVGNFYTDEPTVKRILLNSFRGSKQMESYNPASDELVLVDLEQQEQQQKKQDFLQWNSERQARAADNNNTNSSEQKSNSYYEEQSPVVVYSKTDVDSSIVSRQIAEIPPKQDAAEDDPYSKAFGDEYEDRDDNDYFGQQNEEPHEPMEYYKKQQQQLPQPYYGQQPLKSYYSQPQSYYRESSPTPQYYDDSREDSKPMNSEEARSSPYHDYGNRYEQYPYATASPPQAAISGNNKRLTAAYSNRQLPIRKVQPQYREPFPTYMDDYEYPPTQSHAVATQRPAYANRKIDQQMSQYRTPNTPTPAEEEPESSQQMDFLTMFKSLKTMWDLYQSFTSSWNTLAERRNREQEIAKQKYKQQQQIRINSRKPPKFNTRKNTTTTNKNQRKQTTTTSSTGMPPVSDMFTSDEGEDQQAKKQQPAAKDEPRNSPRGTKPKNKDGDSLRDKRQTAGGKTETTEVAEARYIKGDPLKGYYDFVITEGSYKFWAAFQVGTAILIIYSTFAAIYYSKVNPLVSDYDYTDYLGGARSLSGGDLDFVDEDTGGAAGGHRKGWLEWLPRTSHSLKFVLDAIDKLPTDHAEKQDAMEVNEQASSAEVIDDDDVYTDDAQAAAETETSNTFRYTTANESSYETDNLSDTKRKNGAM